VAPPGGARRSDRRTGSGEEVVPASDYRDLQSQVSSELHEALFEPWTRQDPTPAFRWDPAEDVRYALRADDPSGQKSTTQHGANRLAALGLRGVSNSRTTSAAC
jgi:hypothetical protein